jgi:hypothetical protein
MNDSVTQTGEMAIGASVVSAVLFRRGRWKTRAV